MMAWVQVIGIAPTPKEIFIGSFYHYYDVIMTTMASQITSPMVVYSTVYSDADQRKHQSSASLAFVWGIHRDRWIPRTNGQLRENVSIWWRHHVYWRHVLCQVYLIYEELNCLVNDYSSFIQIKFWSQVNSPHKGQWRGTLMFSLICIWTNGWVNNLDVGDLGRHSAHYGATLMWFYEEQWITLNVN